MKYLSLVTIFLAGLTAAAPAPVTVSERELSDLEKRDITYNEAESGPCKPVTVFFARGTIELGNVGLIAGPPFLAALQDRGVDIARQGVNDYPADIGGFLAGGSKSGIAWLTRKLDSFAIRCPASKIVVGGYSQGAQVARKGIAGSAVKDRIKAVVLFGDPLKGDGIAGIPNGNILTICNFGDLICERTSIVLPPHLTYGFDAGTAANFVVSKL